MSSLLAAPPLPALASHPFPFPFPRAPLLSPPPGIRCHSCPTRALSLTRAICARSVFYILGVFITGLLVPSDDPRLNLGTGTAASAPFVIAIQNAGIKALPSIINACLLTSAWSAASSDLYTSSRALYGLALNGQAPAILKKTNRWGLPWVAVLVGVAFSLLSFMSVGSASAGTVFGYL